MKDFTFGLRFLVVMKGDEMDQAIKYLDSQRLEYKVVEQKIEDFIDGQDMYIIWYKGNLKDQEALIKASDGVELKV